MSAMLLLLRRLPTSNGHRVLVLPGFSASDRSTDPLRNLLRQLDYRTYRWDLGVNVGRMRRILEGLVGKLDQTYQRRKGPVPIVGCSLGGIHARDLAHARTDVVCQVVARDSHIQMLEEDAPTARPTWKALSRCHSSDFGQEVRDLYRPPVTIPNTSSYSRIDGVVSWQACLIPRTATRANVWIFRSRWVGLNSAAIADRLARGRTSCRRGTCVARSLRQSIPTLNVYSPRRLPDQ
ncbi:MAG: alpha/beta hydrolase [Ilumatobacter sp.]|nr:alpha/beta hydrolase [Ilumatobacter sp.]